MNQHISTRAKLGNSRYPSIIISWEHDGWMWRGKVSFWLNENEQEPREYSIGVGISAPLDSLHATIEDFGYGCYAMASFPSIEITTRDLQWATIWAGAALKDHPERLHMRASALQKNRES